MKIGDYVAVNFIGKNSAGCHVGKLVYENDRIVVLEFRDGKTQCFSLDTVTSITATGKADEIDILEEVLDEYRAITNALGISCKLDGTRICDVVARLKSGEYKIVDNKEW